MSGDQPSRNESSSSANGTASAKPPERPVLRDLRGGPQEATPRRPGQRAADADPSHPQRSQLGDGREIAADEHVDRLRGDGIDDRRDVRRGPQPGRVQALGPGLRIRDQAPDGLGKVGPADDESFGPAGEQHARPARVDGRPRCADPLDGERRGRTAALPRRRSNPRSRCRRSRCPPPGSRWRRPPRARPRSHPRNRR